jgi:hypothetical protein
MRTRKVGQLWVVCIAVSWASTSSASDVVEARLGRTVRVTTAQDADVTSSPTGGPTVLGTLLEIEEDAITIVSKDNGHRLRIPRTAVARLEVRRGRTRGQNALIGTGIGLAIGLGVALIEHSRCKGEFLCGVEFALPILTTPAGALVGAAIPGDQRWVDASVPRLAAFPHRPGVRLAWAVTF